MEKIYGINITIEKMKKIVEEQTDIFNKDDNVLKEVEILNF